MLLLYAHEGANQESELSSFSSQKIGPANVLIYVVHAKIEVAASVHKSRIPLVYRQKA